MQVHQFIFILTLLIDFAPYANSQEFLNLLVDKKCDGIITKQTVNDVNRIINDYFIDMNKQAKKLNIAVPQTLYNHHGLYRFDFIKNQVPIKVNCISYNASCPKGDPTCTADRDHCGYALINDPNNRSITIVDPKTSLVDEAHSGCNQSRDELIETVVHELFHHIMGSHDASFVDFSSICTFVAMKFETPASYYRLSKKNMNYFYKLCLAGGSSELLTEEYFFKVGSQARDNESLTYYITSVVNLSTKENKKLADWQDFLFKLSKIDHCDFSNEHLSEKCGPLDFKKNLVAIEASPKIWNMIYHRIYNPRFSGHANGWLNLRIRGKLIDSQEIHSELWEVYLFHTAKEIYYDFGEEKLRSFFSVLENFYSVSMLDDSHTSEKTLIDLDPNVRYVPVVSVLYLENLYLPTSL